MRILFFLLLIIACGLFSRCSRVPTAYEITTDSLKAVLKTNAWILGEWRYETETDTGMEIWNLVNDSLYRGQSYTITYRDTRLSETMELKVSGASLIYEPVVKSQNQGKPVPFKLVEFHSGFMNFENLAHDFPQIIKYYYNKPDSMVAEVSGLNRSEYMILRFRMKRINKP